MILTQLGPLGLYLHLNVPEAVLIVASMVSLFIHAKMGTPISDKNFNIDCTNYPKGIYSFSVADATGFKFSVKKIVIN